jgi:TP901 family phage tail tape measure protein
MAEKLIIEVVLEPQAEKRAFDKVGAKSAQAGAVSAKKFTNGFKASLTTNMSSIAGSFQKSIATLFAVKAGFDIFAGAIKDASAFEQALLEINTILPKTSKLTKVTSQQLKDLSKNFGTSASSQAKSFYQIISAGITDTSQALKLLTSANKLASGGLGSVESSVDVLTDIINVFGGSAKDAIDSLFTTVQLGKTTIPELASSLGFALAPARNLGLSLDDVNASLATLTVNGNSTSENVTQLTSLFSAIAKNSKELGKGFDIAAVKSDGFATVLQRLQTRTKGSSTALFDLLGRKEAVNAFTKLSTNGFQKLNDNISAFEAKAGAAQDAFNVIRKSADFKFKQFNSGIQDLSISVGELLLPAVLTTVRGFNRLTKAIARSFKSEDSVSRLRTLRTELNETAKKINFYRDQLSGSEDVTFANATGNNIKNLGKLRSELAKTLATRKELQLEKNSILALNKTQNEKETRDEIVKNDKIKESASNLARFSEQLGLTKTATLKQNLALDLSAIQEANENKLITDGDYLSRKAVLEATAAEQIKAIEDKRLAENAGFNDSLRRQFQQTDKEAKKSVQNLAKSLKTLAVKGFGDSFKAIGASFASGKSAMDGFADAMKGMFSNLANALGDFYIAKGIALSADPTTPGSGVSLIAAGASLKALSGFLGASSGASGSSGGGSSTGDSGSTGNSGILEAQDIEERQVGTTVNLTVEGTLVQQEELGSYLSDTLSESNQKNGNVILNQRFA